MKEKFGHYNLELEEVLIGTPTASGKDPHIETILTQLRARQIAEEQVETFARQEKAALEERKLREALARAHQQEKLTESELAITIQTNEGRAEYQRAVEEARRIRALAEAEAEKAARVGIGQAVAVEEQVRAYGGPKYQVTQEVMSRFAEAVEKAKVDLVPKIMIGGTGNGNGNGNVLEALLALLLSDRMGESLERAEGSAHPGVDALRTQLKAEILRKLRNGSSEEIVVES
jgi:uncharacterized membrane protein YqiK